MGDILDQLKYLITNQPHHRQLAPQQSIPNTSTLSLFIPNSLLTYWNTKSYTQKETIIISSNFNLINSFLYLITFIAILQEERNVLQTS